MGERRLGRYELVRQLAVGGMAEIYLAKTNGIAGFERYVALKMIHPHLAARERFVRMLIDEAKLAVRLNHPNIVQTFDLGRVDDTFYITMEYVDGADLYQIIARASHLGLEGRLPRASRHETRGCSGREARRMRPHRSLARRCGPIKNRPSPTTFTPRSWETMR